MIVAMPNFKGLKTIPQTAFCNRVHGRERIKRVPLHRQGTPGKFARQHPVLLVHEVDVVAKAAQDGGDLRPAERSPVLVLEKARLCELRLEERFLRPFGRAAGPVDAVVGGNEGAAREDALLGGSSLGVTRLFQRKESRFDWGF